MLTEDEKARYEELRGIVTRLRAPDGCPWDREQTHASLRPHVIEEAYEVLAALDAGDTQQLPEELGDLLFQVLLHTQLAEEAGEFTMSDVLAGLATKLVRRHPHVFGEKKLDNADQVIEQWDALKKKERGEQQSALGSVPAAMPALSYADTLLRRAESAGFAWPDRRDVLDKVAEELDELASAPSKEAMAEELGDLLLNIANYARYLGIDSEEALRMAGNKFRRRFQSVEETAKARSLDLPELTIEQKLALWAEVKSAESNK